ncbi:ferritin-like domain-containing protein [Hydromonas duriensis]|uniref:Uncharacterized ferritin-like protein (DUF455 family) n=1 Tax=Hydromonas duriensis TaxID=1527608 RepID=A0A4R6YBN5_9BURK|nr:ferritin-like domain-containing protein [Hydromonas duriensis]TDR33065.1 uncharacterized ferritin-like protein (DUF455 family) [Hydromonas duriensis]
MTQVLPPFDVHSTHSVELREAALWILAVKDVGEKIKACETLQMVVKSGRVHVEVERAFLDNEVFLQHTPGRPARPELLSALDVPRRRSNTLEGRLANLHALTHIEFNAINLALDAMVRFSGLPEAYYWDWWTVAVEEAYHFTLLRNHLQKLGADYGDFAAHNGLWEMAEKTKDSLGDRMAMVPRTLEARGLDACPVMRDKLAAQGDERGAEIIDIILRDEIGHVAIGNRWFLFACEQNSVHPVMHYKVLAERHNAPRLRPPFNIAARRAAGFFEEELQALADL